VSLAFGDWPVLVAAPADPSIERSCAYARDADVRSLIEETEKKMAPPWEVAHLTIGVDFANGNGDGFAAVFKQCGVTTGRTQSRHPNIQQIPRSDYKPAATTGELFKKMKELANKFPPMLLAPLPELKFPPPIMDQEYAGLTPGDTWAGAFKQELMGAFQTPELVDVVDETGRVVGQHVPGSWGPNNGELHGPNDNRIRREKENDIRKPR
jgi:hypothetical protein